MRNIYLYWVGKEYKLISILRNLIHLHSTNGKGYTVHLITDKNLTTYIKDIPDYFINLCPAHQADFVRVNVVCDNGGIWLDSDTLVLDKLDTLFDILDSKDGFFIKENNTVLWNGVFGSKKQTPLMLEWRRRMIEVLNAKQNKIAWSEIGSNMLENIPSKLYESYEIFNGLDNLYPVNWNHCVAEFIEKPYDNYKNIVRAYQPLVALVHSVYKQLETKTEQEILQGQMPLNHFIDKSVANAGLQTTTIFTNQRLIAYSDRDYISSTIHKFTCWEPNITNIFNSILKDNPNKSNILDIGCNIGYFSMISSNNNTVYSIDANCYNLSMLNLSCMLNGIKSIHTINKCISETSGKYYKPGNSEFVNRIGNIGGMNFIPSTDDGTPSITIDDLVSTNNIDDVLIMKVDIEGGELNALKGATKTLKTGMIKHIIVEISPKFNNDSIEILTILKDNDYDVFNIPHQEQGILNNESLMKQITTVPITDISKFVSSVYPQTNVLAIKRQPTKYIILTDWLKTYLTLEHYSFAQKLEPFGWEIIELSKLNVESIKSKRCTVLCITYDDFDISALKCDNVKLIYKIDDLFPYKEIRNTCINNCDIVIGPYQYLFKECKLYPTLSNKPSYAIHYSAVDEFYANVELNIDPICKVFVSGAVSDVYPFRKFILSDSKFKDHIESLNHPSYRNYTHNKINQEYYKTLNQYLCCFADASCYNYVLLKVFEICSVGSLLLVDDSISDQLSHLGFIDNVNCILCNMNNVQEKIGWVLDVQHRKLVDIIRTRGMDLVRNYHSTSHRSSILNTLASPRPVI